MKSQNLSIPVIFSDEYFQVYTVSMSPSGQGGNIKRKVE